VAIAMLSTNFLFKGDRVILSGTHRIVVGQLVSPIES
jgi:hypothetical protein